jgi:hypothetical protein
VAGSKRHSVVATVSEAVLALAGVAAPLPQGGGGVGGELAVAPRHDLPSVASLEAVLLTWLPSVPFSILRSMEAVVVGEVGRRLSLGAKRANAADAEVADRGRRSQVVELDKDEVVLVDPLAEAGWHLASPSSCSACSARCASWGLQAPRIT